MKRDKILITGPLGNIGSSLIRNFDPSISRNLKLLVNVPSPRFAFLYNLPSYFNYEFIVDDIITADIKNYLKDVTYLIHLAALTNSAESHKQPEQFKKVNFSGLKRIADACLEKNIKLLFPSTTSIYGSKESVVTENCRTLKPYSPYAESKLEAEKYLKKLGRRGLKYTILRFGTVFGHSLGMRFDTAVNKFVWQAVNGLPLSVWRTALDQKRPYLYLGDCVEAINFILKRDFFKKDVYNVLTGNHTVKEVIEVIQKYIPDATISLTNSPIMNEFSYDVSDKKLRKLGFKPQGKLEHGIAEMIFELKKIFGNNHQ